MGLAARAYGFGSYALRSDPFVGPFAAQQMPLLEFSLAHGMFCNSAKAWRPETSTEY